MIKTVITIASAAILTGVLSMVPAPGVQAGTAALQGGAAAPATQVRGGTETAAVVGCPQRAWPYYDQGCRSDFEGRWRGEARHVRLITTDRLN
jgi:hypothetical protein